MFRYLICLSIVIFSFGCTNAQKKEEKLVRKSFDNYKSAILNDKGEEAVNYVDSRTVKYYAEMLRLARSGDSIEVNNLDLMDKLMVFSIRHRASKDQILSFDGKKLLVFAIEEGMIGKNSVINSEIGKVTVDDGFAKGQFVSNGREAPFNFHFYKEEGIWKIDLTSMFPIGKAAFKKMQEESGLDENEYVFYLLEIVTSKKPGKEIWDKVE